MQKRPTSFQSTSKFFLEIFNDINNYYIVDVRSIAPNRQSVPFNLSERLSIRWMLAHHDAEQALYYFLIALCSSISLIQLYMKFSSSNEFEMLFSDIGTFDI